MDSVIRAIILLQFVLCLPSILADCCLSAFKLRILKVALFVMMTALVLCDFCLVEILGIGLVMLNFCMLFRNQNRSLNNRKFFLSLLIFALLFLGGRILWKMGVEFDVKKKNNQPMDFLQLKTCSKFDVHETVCRADYDKRARMAYELATSKNADNVEVRKINETATSVSFDITPMGVVHYEVSVRKDCDKVVIKELTVDGLETSRDLGDLECRTPVNMSE